MQLTGHPDRVINGNAGDIPRRRAPRQSLTTRRGPDHSLKKGAGSQPEQHHAVDEHATLLTTKTAPRMLTAAKPASRKNRQKAR
jgi:hypothetical protein